MSTRTTRPIRSNINPFGAIFTNTVNTRHVYNTETGEWSTYEAQPGKPFDYETYPEDTHRHYTHFEYIETQWQRS